MAKRSGSISSLRRPKGPRKTKKRLAIKKARLEALAVKRGFKK
jgi:hypothetical protein